MSFPVCRHAKRKPRTISNPLVWLGSEPYRIFFLSGILFSIAGSDDVAAFLQGPFELLPRRQSCAGDDPGVRRCIRRRLFGHRRAEDVECAAIEAVGTGALVHPSSRRWTLPSARDDCVGRQPVSRSPPRVCNSARGAVRGFPQGASSAAIVACSHWIDLRNRWDSLVVESGVVGDPGRSPARGSVALSRVSFGAGDGRGHLSFPKAARQ